jgi:hypothetical protein
MDCHDFDSVRLSVITDLAFPRASVCGYFNRPNRFVPARNSLNGIITILEMQ